VWISITLYAVFVLVLCWVCARVVLGLCWGGGTCRHEKASCGHHLWLCCAVLCLLRRLRFMFVGGCVWCVRWGVCGVSAVPAVSAVSAVSAVPWACCVCCVCACAAVAFVLLAVRAQLPRIFCQRCRLRFMFVGGAQRLYRVAGCCKGAAIWAPFGYCPGCQFQTRMTKRLTQTCSANEEC